MHRSCSRLCILGNRNSCIVIGHCLPGVTNNNAQVPISRIHGLNHKSCIRSIPNPITHFFVSTPNPTIHLLLLGTLQNPSTKHPPIFLLTKMYLTVQSPHSKKPCSAYNYPLKFKPSTPANVPAILRTGNDKETSPGITVHTVKMLPQTSAVRLYVW